MIQQCHKQRLHHPERGGEGVLRPYIRMIGMIVVFFSGCNRRFSFFRGGSSEIYYCKKIKFVFVSVNIMSTDFLITLL